MIKIPIELYYIAANLDSGDFLLICGLCLPPIIGSNHVVDLFTWIFESWMLSVASENQCMNWKNRTKGIMTAMLFGIGTQWVLLYLPHRIERKK